MYPALLSLVGLPVVSLGREVRFEVMVRTETQQAPCTLASFSFRPGLLLDVRGLIAAGKGSAR